MFKRFFQCLFFKLIGLDFRTMIEIHSEIQAVKGKQQDLEASIHMLANSIMSFTGDDGWMMHLKGSLETVGEAITILNDRTTKLETVADMHQAALEKMVSQDSALNNALKLTGKKDIN